MTELLDTVVENRWIVQPTHANTVGSTHGGTVVKWMDEVGVMSAMRFSGETCLTVSMDQVNFERPIPVGDIALVEAFVYDAGRTSMDVRIEAYREDPLTGERERTTESYFRYVAVDENQQPTPVPDLTIGSDEGREFRDAALEGTRDRSDEGA